MIVFSRSNTLLPEPSEQYASDYVENLLRKAASALQNAVDFEKSEHFNDALHEYIEGVDMLSVVSV